MKRMMIFTAVLAIALTLFAGCSRRTGTTNTGTNVSTTDNGTVNGTNDRLPGGTDASDPVTGNGGNSDLDTDNDTMNPDDGIQTLPSTEDGEGIAPRTGTNR